MRQSRLFTIVAVALLCMTTAARSAVYTVSSGATYSHYVEYSHLGAVENSYHINVPAGSVAFITITKGNYQDQNADRSTRTFRVYENESSHNMTGTSDYVYHVAFTGDGTIRLNTSIGPDYYMQTVPGQNSLGPYIVGHKKIYYSTYYTRQDYTIEISYESMASKCLVSFETNCSTPCQSRLYSLGGVYLSFPSIAKTDYTLVGWFSDPGLTKPISPSDTVSASVVKLFAKWVKTSTLGPAKLLSLAISGRPSVFPGHSETYTCVGKFSTEIETAVTPSWSIISGSAYASLSSDGVFVPNPSGQNQTVTILAEYGGMSATKTLKILENSIAVLSIDGETYLRPGGSARYACSALYSDDSHAPVQQVTWTLVSGGEYGSLSNDGTFVANTNIREDNLEIIIQACVLDAKYGDIVSRKKIYIRQSFYEIAYDYQGGSPGEHSPDAGFLGRLARVSEPSAPFGYHFVGWTVTGDVDTTTAKWGWNKGEVTHLVESDRYCYDRGYGIHTGDLYFLDLSSKNRGKVTLKAHYDPVSYGVFFDVDGGTSASGLSSGITTAHYNEAFGVSPPTKAGYVFAGWSVTQGLNPSTAKWGCSPNPDTSIASTSTVCVNGATGKVYFLNLGALATGVTLKANWTEAPVTKPDLDFFQPAGWPAEVFLTREKGSVTPCNCFQSNDTVHVSFSYKNTGMSNAGAHHATIMVTDKNLTKALVGNDHESPALSANSSLSFSQDSFTISWKPGTYSVYVWLDSTEQIDEVDETGNIYIVDFSVVETKLSVAFEENGGSSCSMQEYTVGRAYGSLPQPRKKGYAFDGWYTSPAFSTKVTSSSIMSPSTTVLYAKWTPIAYSISYSYGVGSTTVPNTNPTVATYDAPVYIAPPRKRGYIFTGWTVSSGLDTSTGKWGLSDTTWFRIPNCETSCDNGETGGVYFKNLRSNEGGVTLTANWATNPSYAPNLEFFQSATAPVYISREGSEGGMEDVLTTDVLHINISYANTGHNKAYSHFVDARIKDSTGRCVKVLSWTHDELASRQYTSKTSEGFQLTTPGQYSVSVILDSGDNVSETDESDNTLTLSFTVWQNTPKPNLAPYKPTIFPAAIYVARRVNSTTIATTVTAGERLYLNFAYINSGEEAAASHRVAAVVKDPAGGIVAEWNIKEWRLGVNDCRGVTNLVFSVASAGTYTVCVTLDSGKVLDENDELDNTYQMQFMAEAKPNLTLYKPKSFPAPLYLSCETNSSTVVSTITAGATAYLNFAYANFGTTAAASHRVGAEVRNEAGDIIAEWNLKQGRLGANACCGVMDLAIPVMAPGTYTVSVTLDSGEVLDESNETDNVYDLSFTVATKPNLTPYKPKAWPAEIYLGLSMNSTNMATEVQKGQLFYVNFAYANFGNEAAASHRVGVTVRKDSVGTDVSRLSLKQWRLGVNDCRGVTNVTLSVETAGVYTVYVTLDSGEVLEESNEVDNIYFLSFKAVDPMPASYKVVFNANGGKGTMAAQTIARNANAKLVANRFSRTGYVFLGWAKSKSGAVAYKNTATVKNLAAAGKTETLYAKWAKKSYKVQFVANGGKGKMAAEKMTYGKAKKLSANKFKRTGYVFKGWAKSKALAKKGKVAYKNKKSVKNLTTTGKTVKLYAVWKKK